jgi:queuosine precursor transporter
MQGIAYLASILLANVIVNTFGIVTVLGITFPAGAPLIGCTFTLRDMVQRRWGKLHCWWWMMAASLITVAFNPQLAYASFAAFMVAEGLDWLVFTYAPGSFTRRVMVSNLVGLPLDSIVFVALAFGWVWPAIIGQTVVKLVFGAGLVALAVWGRKLR